MRKAGRILAGLFALCLSLYMGAADCMAAQQGKYTYTVTLHAGNHGEIRADAKSYVQVVPPADNSGAGYNVDVREDAIVVSGLAYGSRVNLQARDLVDSTNGKYYVKGARLSGRDDADQRASCLVTGDQDFVAAYGVTGEQVSYTVNYQDENGNAMAESRVYYGNIGDRPVVAFRYIDGYEPQAYNLTKTLAANAAENIFTFVYRPVQAGGGTGTGTGGGNAGGGGGQTGGTTVPSGGQTAGNQGAAAPAAQGTPAPVTPAPGGATPGGAAAPAPGGADTPAPGGADAPAAPDEGPGNDGPADDQPGVNVPDDNVPLDNGPQEYENLDDDDVPLADLPGSEAAHGRRMSMVAVAAGIVGAAALIGLFILLWMQRKKKKEQV